ncbi:putative serine racemase [Diplonema papillatum]|nr:putative serine racemase [Diplonema papillatum]
MGHAIEYSDVEAASERLRGKVIRTPLLESDALNRRVGMRVLVKADCLQRAGSFKIRGAMNRVLKLSAEDTSRGVVAFSSGNFGKGLAAACQALGVSCSVVIPADAPSRKKEGVRSFGATVVEAPVLPGVNREVTAANLAKQLSEDEGRTLVHPFEDADVIAGQGSLAVEVCETLSRCGLLEKLTGVVIPAGGGGLSAGCNVALHRLKQNDNLKTYIAEPAAYDDHCRSLAAGQRLSVAADAPSTVCDALQAASPGVNTFPINQQFVAKGVSVSDEEAVEAQAAALDTLGIELEPSGAVALAAVLFRKVEFSDIDIFVVVASGGNPNAKPLVGSARVLGD